MHNVTRLIAESGRLQAMTAVDSLATLLLDSGVRRASSVLGDGVLTTAAGLAAHGEFALLHTRHEQGAVGLADGYSRFSGDVGVAIVTHGAGLTNSLTSLVEASSAGTKVLLIAPETSHNRRVENPALLDAIGVPWMRIDQVAPSSAEVAELTAYLRDGSGPLAALVSTSAQPRDRVCDGRRGAAGTTASPHPSGSADWPTAVSWIRSARRPVILAGYGALQAASRTNNIVELAARIGAPLVTTLKSSGLHYGSPAVLGAIGDLGADEANRAVADADLVVALGASLNPWTTLGGALLEQTRVVRSDVKPAESEPAADTLHVHADCEVFLTQILARIPAGPSVRPWFQKQGPKLRGQLGPSTRCGLDPVEVLATLDQILPLDRSLVLDGGHFSTIAAQVLRSTDPSRFTYTYHSGAIGQGISVAAGAATAPLKGRVCLVVGDAGYLMGIAELDTMVRYRLPVTIVVMNDGGQGQERIALRGLALPPELADVPAGRVGAVAEAAGAHALDITTRADLSLLGDSCRWPGGPVVVDVRVDPAVVNPAAKRVAARFSAGPPHQSMRR
jgi:acetolactate synthase I/II/III large subunit